MRCSRISKAAADCLQTGRIAPQEFRPAGPEKKIAKTEPPDRYAVFDVETRRSAAEVGGWHRADRMGISVAVLYDSALDNFKIYLEKDVPDLIRICRPSTWWSALTTSGLTTGCCPRIRYSISPHCRPLILWRRSATGLDTG